MDGTSLPQPESGAQIIQLSRDGTDLRCQAISQVSGEQCKFHTPPGEVFCDHHTRRGGDPVLGDIESAEERKEQIRAVRDALTFLCRLGLQEVQATLTDPHARRSDKLKATEIVLKLSVRSGLLNEVKESEDERDLDAEILQIAEALGGDAGVALPDADGDGGEAQLIELAAAQGYEIEFVDEGKEAG